jgi:transposase
MIKSATKRNAMKTIDKVRLALLEEPSCSSTVKTAVTDLIDLVEVLLVKLGTNSRNSSKPPSQDPNRKRHIAIARGHKRKPGGQNGHKGCFLKPVENPTEVKEILIDRKSLPSGKYESRGFESRQVFDVDISVIVTEYRAEVLVNENEDRFVAEFPKGVTERVQYGNSIKAASVYMSQFQLVPLARVQDHFRDQLGLPVSKGSISNWNLSAYEKLELFEKWARQQLIDSVCNNGDETGINIGGKKAWLHCISNEKVALFHPDVKRGREAMERMGILPYFKGNLVHDHWKPYFTYFCTHSLCNSHHLRELEAAIEDNQKWAKKMQDLLLEMNETVEKAGGALSRRRANGFRSRYREIISAADKECPLNQRTRKQSKSRNLLERLRDFEIETLRFLEDKDVPFTNNRGENDIRMTKVQQKISGCFRSMAGAKIFCRIRSYLLTCQKNGVSPTKALNLLFDGKLPDFIAL